MTSCLCAGTKDSRAARKGEVAAALISLGGEPCLFEKVL